MVKCAQCGKEVVEKDNLSGHERSPCPYCGSTSRVLVRVMNENLPIYDRFRSELKGALLRSGRPGRELSQGHDLHRKTGIWMLLTRLIDRKNNLYHEKIVNPNTGEVVHERKERLSKHIGHGSAKIKKK